eukprot:261849-Alexandrium_andersonii.AAC.1
MRTNGAMSGMCTGSMGLSDGGGASCCTCGGGTAKGECITAGCRGAIGMDAEAAAPGAAALFSWAG